MAEGLRTVIFPSTAKEVSDDAFKDTSVRSVILREGIEEIEGHSCTLGGKLINIVHTGIFSKTQIR